MLTFLNNFTQISGLYVNYVLILAFFLFFLGFFGALSKINNLIIFFMSIELMWLGISLCFLSAYIFFFTALNLIFAIAILTIAAAETAIGLSLLVNFYRINKSISLRYLSNLRG